MPKIVGFAGGALILLDQQQQAAITQGARRIFQMRTPAVIGENSIGADSNHLFETIVKDPASTFGVELNIYELCASKWQPNEDYDLDEFVLPRVPNGFTYKVTIAGRSSSREPRWLRISGTNVNDGSAVWMSAAPDLGGINEASAFNAVSDPLGLTLTDFAVADGYKLWASYAGGIEGQDHDVVFTFTINGRQQVARQRVQIRRQ